MTDNALVTALLERLRHDTRDVHERVLSLAEGLPEPQLRARLGEHAPSIAFQVWHLARWAEHDAELFGGHPATLAHAGHGKHVGLHDSGSR